MSRPCHRGDGTTSKYNTNENTSPLGFCHYVWRGRLEFLIISDYIKFSSKIHGGLLWNLYTQFKCLTEFSGRTFQIRTVKCVQAKRTTTAHVCVCVNGQRSFVGNRRNIDNTTRKSRLSVLSNFDNIVKHGKSDNRQNFTDEIKPID